MSDSQTFLRELTRKASEMDQGCLLPRRESEALPFMKVNDKRAWLSRDLIQNFETDETSTTSTGNFVECEKKDVG